MIDSPLCVMCSQEEKNHKSFTLWMYQVTVLLEKSSVLYQGKCINCRNLELVEKFILFGDLQNVFTDKAFDLTVFNLIVTLAKFYIYKCKWQETAPNIKAFCRMLKTGILWKDIYILL